MFTSKAGRVVSLSVLQDTRRLSINATSAIARGTATRLPKTRPRNLNITFYRSFTVSSNLRMVRSSESNEADSKTQDHPASESKEWISILENTTSSPWLFSSELGPEEKLSIAYVLLSQIILYLSRPQGGEQFLTVFGTAPAPLESEIGRARVAVPVILRATVHHLSTIPLNSPLRREHSDIFDIFGALQAIHDMYLTDTISDLETWTTFWSKAQPVVVELVMKLDKKGFGLPLDEVDQESKESK